MDANYRTVYIDLCVENLKNNKSVQQSLNLMTKILGNGQKKSKKITVTKGTYKKKKQMIESLDQKNQILVLFFKDLILYKSAISDKSADDTKHTLQIGIFSAKLSIIKKRNST